MKHIAATALSLALMSAPAFADGHATGDADAGEKAFKKCKACHSIVDADGEAILKGGRTGPNLYGIYKRVAGTDDFRYGDSLVEAGEAGLAWDEAAFVEFVSDPKKYLASYLDDNKARSKMSFKLRNAEDAADIWTYLVSVGPEADGDS